MSFSGKLGLRLLGAFQFLTTIPIQRSTAPPHEAALFFPLVGAVIGALSAWPLLTPLPVGLAAGLTLATQLALTGMLHEDGLADVADAIRAGRTREKMFEILKDSRIGSYGACALVAALLLRWQGIVSLREGWEGLVLSEAMSRVGILFLGFIARPAREGMGAWLCESKDWATRAMALLFAAGGVLWLGWPRGLAMVAGLVVFSYCARQYFLMRLGGVVGDCFGAFQQVAVIFCLCVLAWPGF
jgi:adenosylcobinamide-GDP ribazoletransferase